MRRMTRREARAWLAPMRRVLRDILTTGECITHRGYPVTRMPDGGYARVDWCCAGFRALIERLFPGSDTSALARIERRLAAGTPITHAEIEQALATMSRTEDQLVGIPVARVKDAVLTEQICIEIEQAGVGMKEAA